MGAWSRSSPLIPQVPASQRCACAPRAASWVLPPARALAHAQWPISPQATAHSLARGMGLGQRWGGGAKAGGGAAPSIGVFLKCFGHWEKRKNRLLSLWPFFPGHIKPGTWAMGPEKSQADVCVYLCVYVYVCRGGRPPLRGGAPHSDRTAPSPLSPRTHLRAAAAAAAGPRPPELASYCPQHPGTCGAAENTNNTLGAHTHTHSHTHTLTYTHIHTYTPRHTPAGASWRQHVGATHGRRTATQGDAATA